MPANAASRLSAWEKPAAALRALPARLADLPKYAPATDVDETALRTWLPLTGLLAVLCVGLNGGGAEAQPVIV